MAFTQRIPYHYHFVYRSFRIYIAIRNDLDDKFFFFLDFLNAEKEKRHAQSKITRQETVFNDRCDIYYLYVSKVKYSLQIIVKFIDC